MLKFVLENYAKRHTFAVSKTMTKKGMKFIITVKEHRYLGYILTQHLVALAENQQSYNVLETVVLSDTEKYPDRYTPEQKQIAKLIDDYSDANIAKTTEAASSKTHRIFLPPKMPNTSKST